MKSRRLTETDLANMAFHPVEIKQSRLLAIIKPKRIHGSYEPFRSTAGDAVNQQFPFLEVDREATALGKLEEVVVKACKGDPELVAMNLLVARATHQFSVEQRLTAERAEIRSVTLPFGHRYEFGMPLIVRYRGAAYAVFPDLRRTTPLTPMGSRVVFSWMHQRWRVNYPDLVELSLVIWRYTNSPARDVREVCCADGNLIPFDALIEDATETYTILHRLLDEQEDRRRKFSGDAGPLFGAL